MNETFRFPCEHCSTDLEVPLAFAGVTGPCPCCGETITAPELEPNDAVAEPEVEILHNRAAETAPVVLPMHEPRGPVDPRPREMRTVKKVSSRGPNVPKILGLGTLLLGGGAAAAAAGMLYFTQPKTTTRLEAVGAGKGGEMQARADLMETKKTEATLQAVDVVREFLARGATGGNKILTGVNGSLPEFSHPLFPSLEPAELVGRKVSRKVGSDDFMIEMAGPNSFPVFLVEQINGSSRIHARALQEQVDASLKLFLSDRSADPYVGYFKAKPTEGKHPVPSLGEMMLLSVKSAFPNPHEGPQGCAAVVEPHSLVAKRIEEVMQTSTWTDWENALLELRWAKTDQGESFIKVASIIPCGWSKL